MNEEYLRLPKNILDLAIRNDNEYGWRQGDVLDVIEAARKVQMATIGGQVQYVLPNGICELYWLTYDPSDRKKNEDWLAYCDRSAYECSEKFKELVKTDIDAKAVDAFFEHLTQDGRPLDNLNDYQVFILYFNEEKTYRSLSK